MNLKELYQEIILDHGKNPRNLRKTDNFNKDAKGHNPLCGDKVHIFLKLNENKKVEDISFEGQGCAISMASASIMTDLIKGKEEKYIPHVATWLNQRRFEDDDVKPLNTGPTLIQKMKKLGYQHRGSEQHYEQFTKDNKNWKIHRWKKDAIIEEDK